MGVTAVYLDGREPVLGFFHAPQAPASGLGLLLVPPFGWDEQSSYRPRRDWAAALAREGHAALRIDLPGTGDSGGSPRDADLLGAWSAAVAEASRWLRGSGGAERLAVAGIGLGGLVALSALAAGAVVDDLVLWGVPARGRAVLRELKAFGRLELFQTGEAQGEAPEGELRAGGHVLAAETARAIGALDAAALLRGRAPAPARALVLGRDGVGPDDALVAALADAGVAVQTDPGRGWGAALAGPQSSVTPADAISRVSAWLRAAPATAAGAPPSHAAPGHAELDIAGVRVRERILDLRDPRLFGILTEPAGGPSAPGTAVLLNAGAVRHIGPNRLWTETARRWAARGVPTLRLDVEGIGEADGDTASYAEDEGLYVPALTRQVLGVLDRLEADGFAPNFLLAGLCSGAYWAFQSALQDERVRCAVLLNPRLLFWDGDAASRRELRRALSVLTPSGMRLLLGAERPLARLRDVLRWILAAQLRRRRPRDPGDPLGDALERLAQHPQRVELAFSDREPLRDELARSGRLAELSRRGVRVHALPYHSHTLKPLGAQAAAGALLDDVLGRAFAS